MRKLRLHRKPAPAATPAPAQAKASQNTVKTAVADVLGPSPIPVPNPPPSPLPTLSAFSPRQLAFINAYCELKHVGNAAIKAGYSKKGADRTGARLLGNAMISQEIKRRMGIHQQVAMERVQVNEELVLRELVNLATWNMADYLTPDGKFVDFTTLTRAQAAAIQEITIEEFTDGRSDKRQVRRMKVKMAPKTPNLELLGKYQKMFEGDQKPLADAVGLLGAIMREIDTDARAARAKTINHEPMPAGGAK